MRALPQDRKKPFTPKELNQQAKFRIMNKFLKPAKTLLNVTFAHLAVQMSPFNKAFSYNIKNAITGVKPNLAIDFGMALISRGDLPNVDMPTVNSPSPSMLQFTWSDNSGRGKATGTDKAFVAVYHEEIPNWEYQLDVASRTQGKCEILLKNFAGKSVHTFIGFISADGKDASNSLYTGLVNT